VPGFAATRDAADADAADVTAPRPTGGTRQLNVRVQAPLIDRYRRLLRDCQDEGLETSMTELVHALLHSGPSDVAAVRRLIRSHRRALTEQL
jgi:hypothetical protein